MGEMSAASTTTPAGVPVLLLPPEAEAVAGADLRSALTTSLTPRLRDLFFAAVGDGVVSRGFGIISCVGPGGKGRRTLLHGLQHLLPRLLVRQRVRERDQRPDQRRALRWLRRRVRVNFHGGSGGAGGEGLEEGGGDVGVWVGGGREGLFLFFGLRALVHAVFVRALFLLGGFLGAALGFIGGLFFAHCVPREGGVGRCGSFWEGGFW